MASKKKRVISQSTYKGNNDSEDSHLHNFNHQNNNHYEQPNSLDMKSQKVVSSLKENYQDYLNKNV